MSLPIAQFAPNPNLSLPYAVPNYEKSPKLWEKALASFLSGVVNQAGGQLVENVMSKDYAPEGERAGFWKRAVEGPTVGAKQNDSNEARRFETERQNAQIAHQLKLEELQNEDASGRSEAAARNAQLLEGMQGENAMERQILADRNASLRGSQNNEDAIALEMIKSRLENESPENANRSRLSRAQSRNLNATAAEQELQNKMRSEANAKRNGGGQPGEPVLSAREQAAIHSQIKEGSGPKPGPQAPEWTESIADFLLGPLVDPNEEDFRGPGSSGDWALRAETLPGKSPRVSTDWTNEMPTLGGAIPTLQPSSPEDELKRQQLEFIRQMLLSYDGR